MVQLLVSLLSNDEFPSRLLAPTMRFSCTACISPAAVRIAARYELSPCATPAVPSCARVTVMDVPVGLAVTSTYSRLVSDVAES